MTFRHVLSAALLGLVGLAAPALAQTSCSGGGFVADAQVVPPAEIGAIASATQHAWDGGQRLVTVCDLLTEGANFHAEWSLFSGEVDAVHGGICVSLTATNGRIVYSCATPAATAAAFAAAPGTPGDVLRFEQWFDTAQAAPAVVPAPAPAPAPVPAPAPAPALTK